MNDIRDIVHDAVKANRAAYNLRVIHSTHGGRTTWHKRKVVSIAAPLQSGALARTIRIHETLHANNSPLRHCRKYPELALRCLAIVTRLGEHRHTTKLQSRLLAAFGPIIVDKLTEVLRLRKSYRW